MNKTKKLSISSIACALGVIILYIGSVLNVLDLTMAAITSVLVVFAVIELGGYYPYAIYTVTAILSLLLLPQKFPALIYALFAGIYPIFKAMFERLHYIVSWTLKLSLFNTGLILIILISEYVFKIPDTGMGFAISVFALANVTFVIFDIALTRLITLYLVKIRKKLGFKDLF